MLHIRVTLALFFLVKIDSDSCLCLFFALLCLVFIDLLHSKVLVDHEIVYSNDM